MRRLVPLALMASFGALLIVVTQAPEAHSPCVAEAERTSRPGLRPRAGAMCDAGRTRRARRRARSRSRGLPFEGRLIRGVRLEESDDIRYLPEYAERGNHYGTWQLVQLLERAAERVQQRLPGARLSVGELSGPEGGHLDGHRSHQNGRDADLSFYMTDARGNPREPFAYADFGGDGEGRGPNAMLRFDDARNWELVGKLVADGDARVQRIFVSRALKRRLLREGRRRGAPASVLNRAERVMTQPSHHAHANHFHVRIYCNPHEQGGCRDRAPFHGWYPGTPPR
ncbi:MAG: penicillin-insensitive murein endopeptidase [Sandaracinaceae bacterium]